MRREYGNLHLVPPGWDGSADDAGVHVVDTYRHGPSDIKLAIELARLAGDEARAIRIKQVVDRGWERDEALLHESEIRDLIAALDGLEDVVRDQLLDEEGLIPLAKVADLRTRSTYLDLDEGRGATARFAVQESIPQVIALRAFLREALSRGMHVALD